MLIIEELKRRNVFRVGIAYAVAAWLLIQIADTVFPLFGFDEGPARVVVILLAIGFVPALIFTWVFEFTPEGLQKDSDVDRSNLASSESFRMLDRIIVLILALAFGYFAFDKFVLDPVRDETQIRTASEQAAQQALAGVSRFDSAAPSIAVLPFTNLSSDIEQEYFADGLSEEILNLLKRIDELKVIARTSSFAFKGRNEDARSIGAALNVKTLLTGSVRKSGEQVRITAALIDVSDGSRIWSENYERKMTDVFSVQDDVAAEIINALQIHVDVSPTRGRPTESTDAYALFLRARIALNQDDVNEAEGLLLQAIDHDAKFAEAYELLSYCYWYGGVGPTGNIERRELIFQLAAKALATDPELVFAQVMYRDGNALAYRFLDRLNAFERAVSKDPSNTELLDALAWDLSVAGYKRDALKVAERYIELDPISLPANSRYWRALYAVGRIDDAYAAMDVYEQLGANNALWIRGRLGLTAGHDDDAIPNFETYLVQEGVADTSWVRELVTGARIPATGKAYLDRRIPEIVASLPEEDAFGWQETLHRWYLHFGYLDRYFDLILDPATETGGSVWYDAETAIEEGTMIRESGFTAHPRFLDVAESFGFIDAWEVRGPPDFCQKIDSNWVCE